MGICFLALASVYIDPTLTGLICLEEPEKSIIEQRDRAFESSRVSLSSLPAVGDDNPLRQVIIKTRLSIVVGPFRFPPTFAVPEQRIVAGTSHQGCASFRFLSGTSVRRAPALLAKGRALAFLGVAGCGGGEMILSRRPPCH